MARRGSEKRVERALVKLSNVKGVFVPVIPEIYAPVLKELATMDIAFEDTVEKV